MSDQRAIPDEERPFIPEELVPRQESDDPIRAHADDAPEENDDEDDDDTIEVEDLP